MKRCSWCGNSVIVDINGENVLNFRDRLSFEEFFISGLCQDCQDKVFVEPEEDDDEEESPF